MSQYQTANELSRIHESDLYKRVFDSISSLAMERSRSEQLNSLDHTGNYNGTDYVSERRSTTRREVSLQAMSQPEHLYANAILEISDLAADLTDWCEDDERLVSTARRDLNLSRILRLLHNKQKYTTDMCRYFIEAQGWTEKMTRMQRLQQTVNYMCDSLLQ